MINFKCYKIILILLSPLGVSLGTYAGVQGALPGEFSVSSTLKVHFSQGNFQYQPSTHKCRFAGNQYDMIGSANSNLDVNTTSSYSGWIDLFGWGTGDNPGKNSSDYTNYTVFTDWGINPITNGGNKANLWRTLSVSEWEYLLSVRTNASSKRSIAKINGKAGFILLPDAWTLPDGVIFHANAGNYDTNVYTITEWSKMEANGAVFFPAAGHRNGSTANITNVNSRGEYRTTSKNTYIVCTSSGEIKPNPNNGYLAHCGMSVRLVQDINENTITFNANGGLIPTNGNMGNTPAGQITTLSTDRTSGTVVVTKDKTYFQIMANDCPSRVGYTFAGWYTDPTSGVQVYDNTGYRVVGTYWNSEGKWIGTSNVTLYAHWTPIPYTITVNSSNVSQGTAAGGGTYDYGTNHQITATPNECYQFTKWSDGNTDNPRTITVTGDATYTAEFEQIKYTITFKNYDGTVLQNGDVACGTIPTYIGDIPARSNSNPYQYIFKGWTPNIEIVSGDAVYTAVFEARIVGALSGEFTISPTSKVHFSRGNLQCKATDYYHWTWQFAAQQYEARYEENSWTTAGTHTLDLFGWGTTGYNNKYPTMDQTEPHMYGPDPPTDIAGTRYEWGPYMSITNGGNMVGLWRMMSADEYHYVLYERANADILKGKAMVDGVNGFLILPDAWVCPSGFTINVSYSAFNDNTFTAEEWGVLEEAGAVFFPCAGERYGTNLLNLRIAAYYWTSTYYGEPDYYRNAYTIDFNKDDAIKYCKLNRGRSVRLVISSSIYDAEVLYMVTANATNGTVVGGGIYAKNSTTTLTATPNECYRFTQWSDGNTDNPRTITVTGDATYTAEFEKIQYTIEAQSANPSQGSATVTNP